MSQISLTIKWGVFQITKKPLIHPLYFDSYEQTHRMEQDSITNHCHPISGHGIVRGLAPTKWGNTRRKANLNEDPFRT